jgi:hypothetical protein
MEDKTMVALASGELNGQKVRKAILTSGVHGREA